MARALRVDDVVLLPGGRVEVRITDGQAPLPAEWSGHGVQYPSTTAARDAVQAEAERIETILLSLLAHRIARQTGGFNAQFITAIEGKTITLDLDVADATAGLVRITG